MNKTHTLNTIFTMKDEELAELNKKLKKQLAIKFAVAVGTVVAVHLLSNYIAKKFEDAD